MLCLYGVVRAGHPFATGNARGLVGVQAQPVRVLRRGDLAVIVSEVGDDLLARRRDVQAHLTVLEEALVGGDVLPFRFGAIVENDEEVVGLLDRSAPRFLELLARVGGRVQMTVKLVRDEDAAVRAVVAVDPRLRQVVAASRGTTVWAEKVALGERIAMAVDRLCRRDLDEVTRRLSSVAEAIEVNVGAAPVVATVALLVDPARLVDLDGAVAELHDELGQRMTFEYAGPMPAYSFVK